MQDGAEQSNADNFDVSNLTATNTLRSSGFVKFFNSQKGFGFIVPQGGDVFVHHTQIVKQDNGFRSLGEGEFVEFDMVRGPKGSYAANVTGPGGTDVIGDINAQAFPPFFLPTSPLYDDPQSSVSPSNRVFRMPSADFANFMIHSPWSPYAMRYPYSFPYQVIPHNQENPESSEDVILPPPNGDTEQHADQKKKSKSLNVPASYNPGLVYGAPFAVSPVHVYPQFLYPTPRNFGDTKSKNSRPSLNDSKSKDTKLDAISPQ